MSRCLTQGAAPLVPRPPLAAKPALFAYETSSQRPLKPLVLTRDPHNWINLKAKQQYVACLKHPAQAFGYKISHYIGSHYCKDLPECNVDSRAKDIQ